MPHQCFCVGPQNGQPLCPCRMRGVQVKDGPYVEIIDHGPVPRSLPPFRRSPTAADGDVIPWWPNE